MAAIPKINDANLEEICDILGAKDRGMIACGFTDMV
jgi:hypothetical protein